MEIDDAKKRKKKRMYDENKKKADTGRSKRPFTFDGACAAGVRAAHFFFFSFIGLKMGLRPNFISCPSLNHHDSQRVGDQI